MNYDEIAFFIGLFGSIHCIGMCGPLAFVMPVNGSSKWLLVWDKVLYNSGRVISYTIIGFIVGLAGKQLWLSGAQQGLSIVSGVFIILAASARFLRVRLTTGNYTAKLFSPINNLLTYALKRRFGHLAVGLINGFLPCGFVYLALIGAVNAASAVGAARFMFWFGMGTFPLMLAATVSSGLVSLNVRNIMNKIVPYFMLCLGVWFVLRGLSLNIPYLSPVLINDGSSICH